MAGGIIQLITKGIQDMYLTDDPHITFFKTVYRRHTNFAVESKPQYFSSCPTFGQSATIILDKEGDLLNRMVLYVEIPSIEKFNQDENNEENFAKKFAWVQNLGFALIKEISIIINGYTIDKQYGEFMYIWSEVSETKKLGLNKMIGNVPWMYDFTNGKNSYHIYVPINFWFSKNIGSSLPLVSMLGAEIKFVIKFREFEECCRIGPTNSIEILENISPLKFGDYIYQKINGETIQGFVIDFDYLTKKLYYIKIVSPCSNLRSFQSYSDNTNEFNKPKKNSIINQDVKLNIPYRIYNIQSDKFVTPKPNNTETTEKTFINKPNFVNCYFYFDNIYLDTAERARFMVSTHQYLIEQTQFNQELSVKNTTPKINLSLDHTCKSMYWVAQMDSLIGKKSINELYNYTNSIDIYDGCRNGLIIDSKLLLNGKNRISEGHFTMTNFLYPYQYHSRAPDIGINMCSFCLYPEILQPSSGVNMSMINQISLHLSLDKIINNQNCAKIRIYTVNYNILRVYNNSIGLAFANENEISDTTPDNTVNHI